MNRWTVSLFSVFLFCVPVVVIAGQEPPINHWVGIFPKDIVFGDTSQTWLAPVFDTEQDNAVEVGQLKISFIPNSESGLTATYSSHTQGQSIENIEPHLYDIDFGYGPYFHLTILDQTKERLKVQLSKTTAAIWVDFGTAFGERNIDYKTLVSDEIYTYDGDGIVVELLNSDSVIVRKEQPADMWCEDGVVTYTPYTSWLLDRSQWFDQNGRSRFDIRYKRGC